MNSSYDRKVLLIKAPRIVSTSQEKFESFFSDLHKFVKDKRDLPTQEKVISFEVLLKENFFHYQIILSSNLTPFIKSLIFAKFKDAEIDEIKLSDKISAKETLLSEFELKRSNLLPLKIDFTKSDDPYIVISAILSKLEHFNEKVVLQLLLLPTSETWLKQFLRENFYFIISAINSFNIFLENPFLEYKKINYREEIKRKFDSSLFLANLRVFVSGESKDETQDNLNLILKALGKFDNGDINSFQEIKIKKEKLLPYFTNRQLSFKGMLLNTQEAAAIFHFPNSDLGISNINHISSKKLEPPRDLPISNLLQTPNISAFATANFRSSNLPFGIKREDRDRHVYIIGKTGVGKSKLIQLLTISDIYHKKGFCLIDPHGDSAVEALQFIPKERITDVIYFNPADIEYPVGFNPLECYTPEAKHQVVTGFIAIFKKLFAATWTNRLEHMLRFTVLALIEAGNATVIDIVRLLTVVEFRQSVIAKIKDPVVKNFWAHEFASWNEQFHNEAIIPIINQVGQFIANDYIRNVVAQKKSAFDFYQAMNEGKIIIINIAKGKLGEENAALLGSMIITKIQEATMARVSIPEKERREFYLYVDEFQHFATEAFNQILSEARKFNLSLTIAHQYIDQLSESIRKTVFGNVGSLICFRVGSEDAHYLRNEFAPQVNQEDLINSDVREIYVKLSIAGKTSEPFSARTITLPKPKKIFTEEIIESSRRKYGTPKAKIEQQFSEEGQEVMSLISASETEKQEEFEEPFV